MAPRADIRMPGGPIALIAALLVASMALAASPAAKPLPESQNYGRADSKTIHQTVGEVLARPEFAKPLSFWQRFLDWLKELIDGLPAPNLDFGWEPGWGRFLFWFITIWCALTLAAILGHVGWRVVSLVRERRAAPGVPGTFPRFAALAARPDEELEALRTRLVAEGKFREATSVMMVLLLKRFHAASVLRFHESKTNGDYVFEFPRSRTERAEFRQFVGLFDGTIYGAAECDRGLYQRMESLYEACLSHAR